MPDESRDPTQADPTRTDPAKADLAKTDATRTDPAKADPAKADPAKADPTKTDAMKAAALRPAAMKPESVKPESVKPESVKAETTAQWRAPLLWRAVQRFARIIIPIFCRLRITGDVPAELKRGPLILAGNHIANCDPMIMTAATARRGLAPRMMATGGLFRAPVIGKMMAAAGHIPVDRGLDTIVNAVPDAADALIQGSVIFIYPEGRIGLDPAMWPERPKTGMARLALHSGAPVVPVAIWGSHAVVAYHGRSAMIRTAFRSMWRRPIVRVHFGPTVDLSGLTEGAVGHAQRASDRVMDALIAALVLVRPDEPRLPRFRDPTRPLSTARVYRGKRRIEVRHRGGAPRMGRV